MNRLLSDINNLTGNVLCIGVTDTKLLNLLKKNQKIGLYELNRQEKTHFFSRRKRIKMNNGKSVKIKKFRSLFKKKAIEYIIIDLNSIFDYYKYVASNSIYVCNTKIYIYGNSEYIDANMVAQKFKRYKTTYEVAEDGNKFLVIVDASKAKYSFFKEKFYIIIDTFHNLGDMISYFLTS